MRARSSDATREEARKLCVVFRSSEKWSEKREKELSALFQFFCTIKIQITENLATKAITWRPKKLQVIRYK